MTQTDLAFVLHTRDYRETSLIVRLFARGAGRFSAVYRGARRRRGSPVQPFSLLQVRWRGRAELKTLTGVELDETFQLRGRRLYIGLYLNELLTRLLHEHETHESLFDHYHFLLRQLLEDVDIEPLLRHFELLLLRDLGYGIPLHADADTGEPLEADAVYRFSPESGMRREPSGQGDEATLFSGEHLLAIGRGEFHNRAVRLSAKRLTRLALQPHLGSRPLQSRELFRGVMAEEGS